MNPTGDIDAAWSGEDVLVKLAAAQMGRRWGLADNIGGVRDRRERTRLAGWSAVDAVDHGCRGGRLG